MAESGGPSGQRPVEPGDAQLMALVSQGEVAAFDQLVARYWKATFLYAYHLVVDRESASDLAQEAFARLWERRSTWQPTGTVGAWLFRTARNMVVSDRRRWRLHTRWTSMITREEVRRPRTPLQETEDWEIRAALDEAIQRLSPRRREVFILFHLQDLSHREIGELMGIRPQTVANHLHDAAAELRNVMTRFSPAQARREASEDRHGSGKSE
jgi:RNA polymerase sigma-70 factor, ECF subfamily